jgi:hypothetical protein
VSTLENKRVLDFALLKNGSSIFVVSILADLNESSEEKQTQKLQFESFDLEGKLIASAQSEEEYDLTLMEHMDSSVNERQLFTFFYNTQKQVVFTFTKEFSMGKFQSSYGISSPHPYKVVIGSTTFFMWESMTSKIQSIDWDFEESKSYDLKNIRLSIDGSYYINTTTNTLYLIRSQLEKLEIIDLASGNSLLSTISAGPFIGRLSLNGKQLLNATSNSIIKCVDIKDGRSEVVLRVNVEDIDKYEARLTNPNGKLIFGKSAKFYIEL